MKTKISKITLVFIISSILVGFWTISILSIKAVIAMELQFSPGQTRFQIDQTRKEFSKLQAETGVWCYDFNTNLKHYDKGTDVQALQVVLEKQGIDVRPRETSSQYFGYSTVSAVKQFQEKYRQEVLTPLGLKSSTGYVGPSTRDKLNELYGCVATPSLSFPPRGIKGDNWADIIIGKPDFSEVTPYETVPFKVFNPAGVVVDRSVSPGRLYVWDSGNSRILGIDLAHCYNSESPCVADIVLGQPSAYNHSACNGDGAFQNYPKRASADASTLCGLPEDAISISEWKTFISMFIDDYGNLYVFDPLNHRVLKYIDPFNTDSVADEVWGQPNFVSNGCNISGGASPPSTAPQPTASSLCSHSVGSTGAGVTLDTFGNLWVADGGNNRVLRFPKDSNGVIGKTADLVLGQQDFTTGGDWSFGNEMSQMHGPKAVRFSAQGNLYVADGDNNRILVFEPPFISGMDATRLFGSNFCSPLGIEIDLSGQGIWVLNHDKDNIQETCGAWSARAELWDINRETILKSIEVPQRGGGSFGIDTNGNILVSVYVYGQDVYRFSPQGDAYVQDKEIFSPPYMYNQPGPSGLRSGMGVEVTDNQLIISDGSRILFWNTTDPTSLENGQSADGVVGAPDFYTAPYQSSCCGRMRADDNNKLWVLASSSEPEIRVYQLPLNNGADPLAILHFPFSVLGGGEINGEQRFTGIAPVGRGDFVWVAHPNTNRVFRIRDPLTNPIVDVILGQTDFDGTECNRGVIPPPSSGTNLVADADMLCRPGAVALDQLGNLFVSDHSLEIEGNFRLLEFNASLFPSDNSAMIFALRASKIFPNCQESGCQASLTWEPAFDSQNRMVVGYNGYLGGRFVGIYNDPLSVSTEPDEYLKDYWSMPYSAIFDNDDNLYIGDLNRARVLIYLAKEKSLKVISPNGGEKWAIGTNQRITWESERVNKVNIYLYNDLKEEDVEPYIIAKEVDSGLNGGSYVWTISDAYPVSEKLKIAVKDSYNNEIVDLSDDYFSLKYCRTDNDCLSFYNDEKSEFFCEFEAGTCKSPGICIKQPTRCILVYKPVCGCDKKTYGNDCFRQIAGVSKEYDEACREQRRKIKPPIKSPIKPPIKPPIFTNIMAQLASISCDISESLEKVGKSIETLRTILFHIRN